MKETKHQGASVTQVDQDEVSLQEFVIKFGQWKRYLFAKWATILIVGIIGAIAGLAYAVFTKPLYTATTTFVLEEEGGAAGGGLAQYAGLASMVGIDIGGVGNGIFQGDNITALYRSRLMIEKTLLSKAKFDGQEKLLVDEYVDIMGLRKKWSKYKGLIFTTQTGNPETRLADSLIGEIIKDIDKKYLKVGKTDKKLNLISVDFTARNELFAKTFNSTLVATVNEFYIQTKTKKSLDNINVLQHQTDSVKAVMNGAISTAAKIVDITPNLNITRQSQRTSPVQKSQFTAEANKAILGELVKNLELSKMNFLKNKPLIQVIDEPIYPIEKDKPGAIKMSLLGFFIGVFLTLFVLAFNRFFKGLREPVA